MTVWLVIKQWMGGRREIAAAFLSEERARSEAGRLVGNDNAFISLEAVQILDAPATPSSVA